MANIFQRTFNGIFNLSRRLLNRVTFKPANYNAFKPEENFNKETLVFNQGGLEQQFAARVKYDIANYNIENTKGRIATRIKAIATPTLQAQYNPDFNIQKVIENQQFVIPRPRKKYPAPQPPDLQTKIEENTYKQPHSSKFNENKQKLQYAAQEFGKAATKSNNPYGIPKEQQVAIDLGNKYYFDKNGSIVVDQHYFPVRQSEGSETQAYFKEVGTKEKLGYKERLAGFENIAAKRFSPQEQEEHTRVIMKDKRGGLRLCNRDGSVYDTTNEVAKGYQGLVAYAVALDGSLITSKHVFNLERIKQSGENAYYAHSTLLGGKPGLCFGLMEIVNGKITYMDVNTGHYKADHPNLYNVLKRKMLPLKVFSKDAVIGGVNFNTSPEWIGDFIQRMAVKDKNGQTISDRYFENIKNINELENTIIECTGFKPAQIVKENAKMGVEHSIRKFIDQPIGHKPSVNIDSSKNFKVTFKEEQDAKRFVNKLKGHNDLYKYLQSYQESSNEIPVKLTGMAKKHDLSNRQMVEIDYSSGSEVVIPNSQVRNFLSKELNISDDNIKLLSEQLSKSKKSYTQRIEEEYNKSSNTITR